MSEHRRSFKQHEASGKKDCLSKEILNLFSFDYMSSLDTVFVIFNSSKSTHARAVQRKRKKSY